MSDELNLPLRGIRIVDLTVVWSGPGGTALLGDLGAEVIRIEGTNRISRQVSAKMTKEVAATSGYHAATYPDQDPGPRPYERTSLFNWHARNKLAANVNLETDEGRQAAIELLKISDVLVENNSKGTIEKLGLDPDELLELNPRLIIARMPAMGSSGPMSDYIGFGPNFNSLVGIAIMDGYEGETPDTAGENYHMDEASPAGIAFAVMAALWDRERTGVGGVIEFAQAENVMQDVGEYFLDSQFNHRNPPVLGNTDPHLLQDVFLTADDNRWVAISIRDDRDWTALGTVVGPVEWLAEGASAALRAENSRALRDHLLAWTVQHPADDVIDGLQSVGIPAGEVMSETRLLADRHLRERDWFKERTHPSPGTHRYPGAPWRVSGFDLVWGRQLPGFGEDNEYVYKTLLHYSDEVYDDLVARGIITNEQLA
jgi:benzylsuccinate CoA-transferase BbsF subunit/naphthyl-2-methylsuccinate CoA transferase subunit